MRARLVLLAAALMLLACGSSRPSPPPAEGWTVLVYMVLDSDIEQDGIDDLKQMAAVGSGNGLNIVVQVQRAGRASQEPIGSIPAPTSSDTKRLLVRQGDFEVLDDLGNVESGDPAVLADFLGWGVTTFPAKQYALVLWDHGGTWLDGFGIDESHPEKTGLSMAEVAQGLSDGLQRAGLSRLALLGFDACLMGTFEVAEAVKGKADYLLASEELQRRGWDYHALATVQANPAVDALTIGRILADDYLRSNAWSYSRLTLSLVDLNQLSALESALAAAAGLAAEVPSHVPEVAQAREEALEFGRMSQLDLGHLWALLAARVPAWLGVQQQVAAGLASAVVYQVRGSAATSASGLSIYFPRDSAVYDTPTKSDPTNRTAAQIYQALPGVATWRAFMEAYLDTVVPFGMPSFESRTATVQPSGNGWLLSGQLTTGSARWVVQQSLVAGFEVPASDPPYRTLYLDRPATLVTNEVQAAWDGAIPRLSQASTFAYGYASLEAIDPTRQLAVIPLAYFADPSVDCASAPEAYWWVVLLGSDIESSVLVMVENGRVAELRPAPGSRVAARYLRSAGMLETYECSTGTLDATADIALDFVKPSPSELPAGAQFYGELQVRGSSGNSGFASASWIP